MQAPTAALPLKPQKFHPYRINSIDLLRGLVMIIMALDHCRDLLHVTAGTRNPLDLSTTTPILFFTRWITHFCAPIFVFLSGLSIYLQSLRKTKQDLSVFLVKRGLWLILLEVTLVTLSLTFNIHFSIIILQVIWAIGISMVILAAMIYLPMSVILSVGLIIVLGHNTLDYYEQQPNQKFSLLYDLVHRLAFDKISETRTLAILYPFLAWTGLMFVGYCCGALFRKEIDSPRRQKKLAIIGTTIILFFIVLRATNLYGDPFKWAPQRNFLFTILSFINTQKYPPSLLFMCMTIGPALLFLSITEPVNNWLTRFITVYGRVPFFYYIIHFPLIHAIATLFFFLRGHHVQDGTNTGSIVNFVIPGEGISLTKVYFIWMGVVLLLYPLCKWYGRYKATHKKWWLSYV